MYIEFYGLPGAGKTTITKEFNKKARRGSYKILPILKAMGTYLIFILCVIIHALTSLRFLKGIAGSPIYFLAFMKGMFVRISTAYKYEKQGVFIADHGLIQMLSQNGVLRRELIRDRHFMLNILDLFPRNESVNYIYLKSNISSSLNRTISRDKSREFSAKFMVECDSLFKITAKHYKSPVINGNNPKPIVTKDIKKILEKIYK